MGTIWTSRISRPFLNIPYSFFLFQTVYDANSSHVTYSPTPLTLVFFLLFFGKGRFDCLPLHNLIHRPFFAPPKFCQQEFVFKKSFNVQGLGIVQQKRKGKGQTNSCVMSRGRMRVFYCVSHFILCLTVLRKQKKKQKKSTTHEQDDVTS